MDPAIIIFIFPIVVIIVSIIGTYMLNNWLIMPIVACITFLILTFMVFNETFLIWVVAYTVLASISSFFTSSVKSRRIRK